MNQRRVGVQRLDVSQQGRRIRQEPRGGDREARERRASRTLQAGEGERAFRDATRGRQAADVEDESLRFHDRDRAQDLRGDGHRNGDRDDVCLVHAFLKVWFERESFEWAGDVIHDDVAPARTEVSAEPLAYASRTADHQDTLVDWHRWEHSRLSEDTLLDQEAGETRTER